MVAVEIDDLLMFGDRVHDQQMQKLQQRFTFGKLEKIDEKGVNFNGRRLSAKDGTIYVDMKAFVEERLEEVKLAPGRSKQKDERLSEEETSLVRRACGSLNWAGREGRPDAAAAASMFSSIMMEMKVSDVLDLNRVIDKIKQSSDLALQIQPIEPSRMCWGVVSDASWGTRVEVELKEGIYFWCMTGNCLKGKLQNAMFCIGSQASFHVL